MFYGVLIPSNMTLAATFDTKSWAVDTQREQHHITENEAAFVENEYGSNTKESLHRGPAGLRGQVVPCQTTRW